MDLLDATRITDIASFLVKLQDAGDKVKAAINDSPSQRSRGFLVQLDDMKVAVDALRSQVRECQLLDKKHQPMVQFEILKVLRRLQTEGRMIIRGLEDVISTFQAKPSPGHGVQKASHKPTVRLDALSGEMAKFAQSLDIAKTRLRT